MVAELVIALPHGGLVTLQLNRYLIIEYPMVRCVLHLCVNELWVGLWNYVPPLSLTLTLTVCVEIPPPSPLTLTLTLTLSLSVTLTQKKP